ncbi:MAG: hypothetical protein NXI27_09620 [Alphaproteobacteria bacterium]|nr:hypothetical protein [Alphaproteobacteria bacterium]
MIEINLFGACIVRGGSEHHYELSGSKHRALLVLLATAPFGRRTRSFLQVTLWGTACYDSGRQSLRRALADIKRIMGNDFDILISSTNADVTLDVSKVRFIGKPGSGEFLEGIDLKEEGFEDWLRGIRSNPEQIHSLFSLASQAPAKASVPTIAILPFRMIASAADEAVLGDWLAEEVCRSLSRSNLISVISHLSAREVTRRSIELAQVREKLAVDYCVCGSVRVVDGTALLDADMLDAESGRILWTRRFSGSLGEFLSSSGDAINEIVRAVGRTIASEAITHARSKDLPSLADHQLLVAGVGLMHQLRLQSFAHSRKLIEESVRRSPRSAESHAWLAEWYVMSVFNGWSTDISNDSGKAVDHVARALDIDPENAFCLTIDGVVNNNLLQRLDVAENRFNLALEYNPNESLSWLFSGVLHAYRDDGSAAVKRAENALRLSPLDPLGYFFDSFMASSYLSTGNFEAALEYANRSLSVNDRHLSTHRARICALHNLGRDEEVLHAGAQLLERQPDSTVSGYMASHPASSFNFGRLHADALTAAGIPKGD